MDEDQDVFKQLTVSHFKKWSSAALKVHSQVKQFLETESPLKVVSAHFY